MVGWINELQGEMGRALLAIHRAGGWQASYSIVKSSAFSATADLRNNVSTVDTYMKPIQRGNQFAVMGGRKADRLDDGGEVFEISREALKISGTYYTPTLNDYFVKYGTTTPVYYVVGIRSLGLEASGWALTCKAEYRAEVHG